MKKVFFWLFIFIILIFGAATVNSQAATLGLPTNSLPEEEKNAFLKKVEIEVVNNDDLKAGILCFDVREDGTIALAIENAVNNIVYVYDQLGKFQYGYRFNSEGNYGVEFQGQLLAIYFQRSNIIMLLDSTGKCVDVQEVIQPNQHLQRINEILERTNKEIADKEYVLERDINIGSGYSRFVVIDKHGERTVIYDATTKNLIGQILLIAFIVVVIPLVLWGIIKQEEARENKTNKGQGDGLREP